MKKIISMITAFLLVVTIVGCSSKSKKYDDEINKVLQKAELKREDINIKVYENVNIDTLKVKGNFNVYSFEYWYISYAFKPSNGTEVKRTLEEYTNSKIIKTTDFYIITKENEILKLPYDLEKQVKNSNKSVYDENNITDDEKNKKVLEDKLKAEMENFKKNQ